ncbi:acyl-CoA/acyl-ACP dehydrogenase [Mycetohabitans sp. B2]|uniref:acyl-CoA dehydrogenase family protein n=1 Tax=Mycetohabitans sp. B2 TaxID=2841274 RepID=UPI001F4684FC|nr:acyl-CoA dehydrogenase family protein [Mycetohabitans sp. B2]MCF7697257.1 acyl-CoA/acyl-ACP dehydrogenase [Mycetohabitans sp. B2]
MMVAPGRQKAVAIARGPTRAMPARAGGVARTSLRRWSGLASAEHAHLQPLLYIASEHATDVDRDARFPTEALGALREAGLMSSLVPASLGGAATSLKTVAGICEVLARACASSAMMFAMHQASVAWLVLHHEAHEASRALLQRLCAEQMLFGIAGMADATPAAGTASGPRPALLQHHAGQFTLVIDGTTIPYGAYADALLLPASENGFIAVSKEQYKLERRESWDALGMRGLCSDEFCVVVTGESSQILHTARHGTGNLHAIVQLLHSAVWVGIAASALERAQAYSRGQGEAAHALMPGAARLAEANALLQMMRAHLGSALEQASSGPDGLPPRDGAFVDEMQMLRTGVSRSALALVNHAMMVCGIDGYRNDTEVSVARHLRDLYAAPLGLGAPRHAAIPSASASDVTPSSDILPE